MGHRNNILRFFAVFGGMNASALLEAGTEKLKAQEKLESQSSNPPVPVARSEEGQLCAFELVHSLEL